MKTKTLKFNNISITFIQFQDTWMVPAKLLGLAMGYAGDGQSLCNLISTSWANKLNENDVLLFEGKELETLKKETTAYNVSFKQANAVTFLTMGGVIAVLMRSGAAMAREFRNFLAKNGGELLAGHSLKPLRAPQKDSQLKLPLGGEKLDGPLAILKEMQATGLFKKEKLAELYMDLFHQSMPEKLHYEANTKVLPAPKDATQMVPVSNIQASSLTPNFDSIRSFFLTGHQKHPKFPDWISAEEIGKPLGKSPDQVKTQSTKYTTQREKELSNNVAMKKVIEAGGYFRGVATLVDPETKLPCYVDEELGCLAVWYLMEDGKLVWRNYWSPKAVNQIRQMLGAPALPAKQESLMPFLPPGVNFEDAAPETKELTSP